jgi:hypothetical protein
VASRNCRTATAGSGAAKIADPATIISAPALVTSAILSALNTAVNLNAGLQSALVNHLAQSPDFIERFRDKFLAAEARD